MSRRRARRRSALVLVLLAIGCAGCALPTQKTASRLNTSLTLPYNPPTTTTAPSSTTSKQLTVYFLAEGHLYPVQVSYGSDVTDPYGAALYALSLGPSSQLSRCGVTSNAPTALSLDGSIRSGVATVSVDPSFLDAGANEVELGEAQVVYTLTSVGGASSEVQAVQFVNGTDHIPAIIPPGRIQAGPVGQVDYNDLGVTTILHCVSTSTTTTTAP